MARKSFQTEKSSILTSLYEYVLHRACSNCKKLAIKKNKRRNVRKEAKKIVAVVIRFRTWNYIVCPGKHQTIRLHLGMNLFYTRKKLDTASIRFGSPPPFAVCFVYLSISYITRFIFNVTVVCKHVQLLFYVIIIVTTSLIKAVIISERAWS